MATKEVCRFSVEKNHSAKSTVFKKSDCQYSNINLNGNHQCSNFDPIHFKGISNNGGTSVKDIFLSETAISLKTSASYVTKETLNFSKSLFAKELKTFPFVDHRNFQTETPKQLKKNVKSSANNNSTLSLHIAAYENAIEAAKSDENNDTMGKKSKISTFTKKQYSVTQYFDNSSSKALFEIPRQQKNLMNEPEIMQFKASQKLLNPNCVTSNIVEQSSESFVNNICLFRKEDNSFICVDIFDLNLPMDEFWELAPGAEYEVPNVGKCIFVISGTQEFLDQRIQNEASETGVEHPPTSRKRKALSETPPNNPTPSSVSLERVCEILIDKVEDLCYVVSTLVQKIDKLEIDVKEAKKEITIFKGKKNSRESNQMVIEAALVEINGVDRNISSITKAEFDNLLAINRQALGMLPGLWTDITERDRLIATVAPILLDLCRTGKYGQFVTLLTKFLIDEEAFSVSFLPPLTLHLRQSRPGPEKRILNSNFRQAFQYYALFFGGAALKRSLQNQWIENLRQKYNVKVQNYNTSKHGYTQNEELAPYFNINNSFEDAQ